MNHETGENLDYDMYPDGRTVIAIGGNRLSRGLTLEGLCVSYFIRSSQDEGGHNDADGKVVPASDRATLTWSGYTPQAT